MDTKRTGNSAEAQACHHLQHQVHALADNTLKGPMRWYTQVHCTYCNQCGTALKTLRDTPETEPAPDANLVPPIADNHIR